MGATLMLREVRRRIKIKNDERNRDRDKLQLGKCSRLLIV